ncbi:hypothetical protein SSKA14_1838 [Stenotrophomonas sp. SKA14]|nr:hypothetical protein SSKA14_1838 [Stenotrophomonas sp. SKA14]
MNVWSTRCARFSAVATMQKDGPGAGLRGHRGTCGAKRRRGCCRQVE